MEGRKKKKQGSKKQRKVKGCLAGSCQRNIRKNYCTDEERRNTSRSIGSG